MSLSTEQMEWVIELCEFSQDSFLIPGPTQRAIYVDGGYELNLAGERVVIEKLKLDLSWSLSEEPYIWFDGERLEGTLSQAIEAAVKAWLEIG